MRFLPILGCLCLAAAAGAQSDKVVAPAQLQQNPRAALNQPIRLKDAYCFAREAGGYECRTAEAVIVRAERMPAGPFKTIVDDECGELDAIELAPACGFDLRFTPKSVTSEAGQYLRNRRMVKGQITVVHTDTITPLR